MFNVADCANAVENQKLMSGYHNFSGSVAIVKKTVCLCLQGTAASVSSQDFNCTIYVPSSGED